MFSLERSEVSLERIEVSLERVFVILEIFLQKVVRLSKCRCTQGFATCFRLSEVDRRLSEGSSTSEAAKPITRTSQASQGSSGQSFLRVPCVLEGASFAYSHRLFGCRQNIINYRLTPCQALHSPRLSTVYSPLKPPIS